MTYVDVLKEKRLEVLGEIERLRAEAIDIASRVAAKEGQLRNLEDLLSIEGGLTPRDAGTPEPSSVRPPSAQSQRFTDAAVALLLERGTPIHYQEIARTLAEQAVYIPGKDPGANLIAHMLRDPRFARAAGRGMYGLAGWQSTQPTKAPVKSTRRRPGARRARTTRSRSSKSNG